MWVWLRLKLKRSSENRGVTERSPNITSTPVKDNDIGINREALTARQNTPIKDTATPAHEVDNAPTR